MVGLKPYVENIWALLLKHCECAEEGTRNVVAECLGKLTLIDPETLLPRLKGVLNIRWVPRFSYFKMLFICIYYDVEPYSNDILLFKRIKSVYVVRYNKYIKRQKLQQL